MIRDSQYVRSEEKEINNIRKKLVNILKYIDNTFYIKISDSRLRIKDEYIDTNEYTLMLLLTYMCDGVAVLKGGYGTGKTSVAAAFSSMFYSLPIDLVKRAIIRGNIGLTEEKAFARPNLGEMNKGKEVIRWSTYSTVDGSILDEFNRIPDKLQNLFIPIFDTGKVQYMNKYVQKRGATIMTVNAQDSANYNIINAISDRINVELYTQPSVGTFKYQIRHEKEINERKNRLRSYGNLERLIKESIENDTLKEKLKYIKEEFRKGKEEFVLSDYERELLKEKINSIEIEKEAIQFISEFQSHEWSENKIAQYNISLTERWKESIKKYSRSLTFLKEDDKVNINHIRAIMPYTLTNKIKMRSIEVSHKVNKVLNIEKAERVVEMFYNKYKKEKQ